jgi:hypothetical protein
MDGVLGEVEDIYPKCGRVGFDRGWCVERLNGVRELEDELGLFREVFEAVLGVGREGRAGRG